MPLSYKLEILKNLEYTMAMENRPNREVVLKLTQDQKYLARVYHRMEEARLYNLLSELTVRSKPDQDKRSQDYQDEEDGIEIIFKESTQNILASMDRQTRAQTLMIGLQEARRFLENYLTEISGNTSVHPEIIRHVNERLSIIEETVRKLNDRLAKDR